MAIVFSEESLRDVEAPCVAQSFLNHNALLHKIFVVGNRQFVVQRPSLKNLYPGSKYAYVKVYETIRVFGGKGRRQLIFIII